MKRQESVPCPLLPTNAVKCCGILDQAKKEGLEAASRGQGDDFAHWLGGVLAYTQMVNPDKGRKLRAAFDNING